MMIGAHPDDEDSALLAYLARGENARTAYLSLTRGDGGQNLIGDELFESLGVIRTEELLQARRLDGAEQFFTRAFDYGFSKTLAEAKEKWNEKIVLCDAVKAIREFRPLVVISRFSGTPADGHGQHQYAGYISPVAVKAAADSTQCENSGMTWQVLKFYVEQGFRDNSEPTLKINTGIYDSLLGRSYTEIALEGRSLHRTQAQGILELKGDRFSGLNLKESNVPKIENEKGIFDGINTTISGVSKIFGVSENDALNKQFEEFQRVNEKALKQISLSSPNEILPTLIRALDLVNIIRSSISLSITPENSGNYLVKQYELKNFLDQKEAIIKAAIRISSGIQIDALSSKETVSPSEDFLASVKIFYPNESNIKITEIKLNAPQDWQVTDVAAPTNDSGNSGFFRENSKEAKFFSVNLPVNAKLTQPYFLEKPRDVSLYQFGDDKNQTLPFQRPLVTAQVTAEINDTKVTFDQAVEYRYADDIRGEIRREINVVPKISLEFDREFVLVADNLKSHDRELNLKIKNNSADNLSGTAALNLPKDWSGISTPKTFSLKKGEQTAIKFVVTIPRNYKQENYEITGEVKANGESFTKTMHTLAYPHIRTHRFYTAAKTTFGLFDLKTAPVKIGYIAGSGDRVADAIRQMNFDVELLNEDQLSNGDLSKYDVIVVGIRASQARPDFTANHQRLLEFVKNGGTMLVQYQLPVYQNLLPFPAKMDARVTDENAKVTILDAADPIFNFPNKITDKDFEGWVQERNLYAFSAFDQNYKPLLESHDANEAENKGGLVVANIGKGKFIYCSYAFFRQLPNGVPGAYRLFANLLSASEKRKKNG